MTSNAARAEALARALDAGLRGDTATVAVLCTDDVTMWAPASAAGSLDELLAILSRRDDTFSEVELETTPLDVGGDRACVEWQVTLRHSGPLTLADGAVRDATGERITLQGVTGAEFRDERICSVRQYWDELSVYEQLGLVGDPGS